MILIEGGNRRIRLRVVLIFFGVGHLHVGITADPSCLFSYSSRIQLGSSTVYVVVVGFVLFRAQTQTF